MNDKKPMELLTIRVPGDMLSKLPPPSLTGERAQYVREAIQEKLERDGRS